MKLALLLIALATTALFGATRTVDHQYDNSDSRWTVTHSPAAATQATIAKAAVPGRRHVVTCVDATIATAATAQTPIKIQVKDGSTVLASWTVAAPANGQGGISKCDFRFIGTLNTAMTLEFSAAGVADSLEAVVLQGYDVY